MTGEDIKIWKGLFSPSLALPPAAIVYLGLDVIVNQVKGTCSLTDSAQRPLKKGIQWQSLKIKICLTVMKTDFLFVLTLFSREP